MGEESDEEVEELGMRRKRRHDGGGRRKSLA